MRAVLRSVRSSGYGAVLDLDEAHSLLLPVEVRHDRASDRYPSERWYQLLVELAPTDPVCAAAEIWAQGFMPPPTLYLDRGGQGNRRLAAQLERWLLENAVAAPSYLSITVEPSGRALRLVLLLQHGKERRARLRGSVRRNDPSYSPRAASALAAGFLVKEASAIRGRLDRLLRNGVEVPASVVAEVLATLRRATDAVRQVARCHHSPDLSHSSHEWSGTALPSLDEASRTSRALLFEPSSVMHQP